MKLNEEDVNIRCALVVYDKDGMVLIEHPLGRKKAPGNWDLPKGHFDTNKDNSFKDTAVRECKEETGLAFSKSDISLVTTVEYCGDILHVFAINEPYDFNLDELYCKSKIGLDCTQKWKVGLPEVDDYYSVSYDELSDWLFSSYDATALRLVARWINAHLD